MDTVFYVFLRYNMTPINNVKCMLILVNLAFTKSLQKRLVKHDIWLNFNGI